MKNINLIKLLKHIIYNDAPIVLKNILNNPSQYVTWEDVENVINKNDCYVEQDLLNLI